MTDRPEPLIPLDETWERALCVVAHADDLEFGAAAAVARWTGQGKSVVYAMVTSGEAGIDGLDPEESVARAVATAGCPPEIMGIGPVPATRKALQRAGLALHEIGVVEINEAFAAQALACLRELELDEARINPDGGAIALGHPLGATGAVRIATLVHGMRRRKQKYGMVTMCIGTGMGAAGIFEAL